MAETVSADDLVEVVPSEHVTEISKPSENPLAVEGGSQEPIGSRVKRIAQGIGKTVGQYDPSNPENVGRVGKLAAGLAPPIVAGILTEGTSVPVEVGMQALAGAASPYAEAAAGRALGDQTQMPSWRDAATSGAINMAFAGLGALKGGASDVAPEMERTTKNVKNLNQAVRNRDFWKSMGLSDEQADMAIKAPDAEAFAARSIENANKTKDAYQGIVNSTREDFKGRYDGAYGDLKDKPISDVAPLVKAFNLAGQPGSERELIA